MKKLLTIVLAAAFLCAAAGQVQAAALETSGEIRVRAWWVDNYVVNEESTEWWDQRLRLNMVWPVAEGVKVAARADILEGMWGTSSDPTVKVLESASGDHTVEASLGSRPQIAFDHAYLMFTWPGTPVTFTAGRQDVSWGTGFNAQADSRDRFKVGAKLTPVSISFSYDKNKEIFAAHGGEHAVDDARGYTLAAVASVAGWNIGALVGHSKDDTDPTKSKATRYAVDAFGIGKAGPVGLKAEVAYTMGTNDPLEGADVDVTGLGIYAGATVAAGPVTIGLEGAYVSGDDPATADNEGGFKADYQGPLWSVILYNNMDLPGYLGSGTGNAVTSSFTADTGVANAMVGKASVTINPAKGFTIIGAVLYAEAIEDVVITKADKTKTTYAADPLGTEFDVILMYAITDNVTLTGGFGYLAAGDFFGAVDDPMGVMGSLTVKF